MEGNADAWQPATVGSAISLFALFVLVQIIVSIVWWIASGGESGVSLGVCFLITQIIGYPLVLYSAVWWSRSTWRDTFPLRRFPTRLVLPLVVLCVGLLIPFAGIASLIPMPESFRHMSERFADIPWYLSVISIVILAPMFEEAFNRGWLLTGLRARYSTRKAIVVSAIVFAVCHLNPWQAVVAFPLGVLFAWLVVRTGSLWPGIIGHAATNATGSLVALVLYGIGYSDATIQNATLLPLTFPPLLIVGALLAVVGGFWLRKEMKSTRVATP